MKASNRPVTSREYKVMLNSHRFKDRKQGAEEFLELIAFLIGKEGGTVIERQNKEERRQTSYLDTPQFTLRQNGFSLRLREEADRFQVNLKYRHADRYVSASKDLSDSSEGVKFEEDILPPFTSKFSHSKSIKSAVRPQLTVMKEVTSLFPGLKEFNIDEETPVTTANNFKALEVTRKLCQFQFEKTEILKASLSFWYLLDETHWPLVTEFSFDYDATEKDEGKLESYSPNVVEGASGLFRSVLNQAGWLDLTTTTKTAFALELL